MSLGSQKKTKIIKPMSNKPIERGKKITFLDPIEETYYFENDVPKEVNADELTSKIKKLSFEEKQIKTYIPESFLLENRIKYFSFVKEYLSTFNINKWKYCISGGIDDFKDKIDNFILIGNGSYGNVYRVSINDMSLVVKETFLKKKIDNEVVSSYINNEILELNNVPNLLFVFKIAFCKECILTIDKNIEFGKCHTIIMESLDDTIKKLFLEPHHIESCILQLLLVLSVLHGQYGLIHRDIKASNILFKTTIPGGFWKYNIAGRTFYVPNYGFLFLLADFGSCSIYHPVHQIENFYGTRNAQLISSGLPLGWGPYAGVEIIIKPFNMTLDDDLKENTNVVLWKDKNEDLGYYTINKVTPENLYSSEIHIELNDMRAFPAWESMGDIYDLLRTFTGGNKFFQPGIHLGLKTILKTSIIEEANLHPDFIFNTNGLASRFLLADVMAAYLFPESGLLQTQIIEMYEWPK